MFSRKARAGEAMRKPPMNGRSLSSGGGPLRGRNVTPGKMMALAIDDEKHAAVRAAGRLSCGRDQCANEVRRDQWSEISMDNSLRWFCQIESVESGPKLAHSISDGS